MSPFLNPETSIDGVASGNYSSKPSHLSLIIINTLVNHHKLQLLIDSGATTTFINKQLLTKHPLDFPYLNSLPYSFVLADGIAPFHVHGIVQLKIQFSNQSTIINAHVADHLCTDIILGMDYITLYNLQFNIRKQIISIELNNKSYTINFDNSVQPRFVPVILSNSIKLPSHSQRFVKVSTPISSICSSFTPHSSFVSLNSVTVLQKFLEFRDHLSRITLSNLSVHPQYIPRGTCLGYLYEYSPSSPIDLSLNHAKSHYDATNQIGEQSAVNVSHDKNSSSFVASLCRPLSTSPHSESSLPLEETLRLLIKHIDDKNQYNPIFSLLMEFSHIFTTTKHTIATTLIHHIINTYPHSPPASKPYSQPESENILYDMIQEFLNAGLISESHSPYAAPAFLVKKKDGTRRLVVDYKKLNLITIKDSSPLPKMEDALQKLGHGYQYFSKIDLRSGFYQIPINEQDKLKTAFVTPFGLFQFNVLPMGLKNSPPTFQKVMNDTLKSCRSFSLVYLDDIVVFSTTYHEHLDHLRQVFLALSDKNFVLNPPKCELCVQRINYLGHTVSATSITPLSEKIETILSMKEPATLAEANKFIGALNWYRKFIPEFALTASPIYSVTNLTQKNRRNFHWRFAQSQAFHQIKKMLTSAPLFLHFPIDDTPLILTTDASGIGLGGVLQQEVDGQLRNLYYHSQLMSPCERKYSTIEKEALAIFKCITRMRSYILGRELIIMTDHCPLCHILTKTVNNSRVDRIANLIQDYNIIEVRHIKGRHNCLPDYFSRFPRQIDDELFDIDYGLVTKYNSPTPLPLSSHQPINMILRPRPPKITKPSEPSIPDCSETSNDSSPTFDAPSLKISSNYFDLNRLKLEQNKDPEVQKILLQLKTNPNTSSFVVHDDTLYRLIMSSFSQKTKYKVIYVPSSLVESLLVATHDDPLIGAHFSFERTYQKLRYYYWWPKMKQCIRRHIKSCILCQGYNKSRYKKPGQLHSFPPPEGPFQIIGIDFCGPLPQTPRDNKYVLVVTDYFTRHITAIPLPSCTAAKTAESLFNNFFCLFGIPQLIVSDQGSHFKNQLMTNISQLIGYNHIYTTPYHPQSNGIVERFNGTFIPQLSKLQDKETNNWDEFLSAIVFAYNTGIHKSTRFSPYELVFGRPPRLPIHPQLSHFSFSTPNDYFLQLQQSLKYFHHFARSNNQRQHERNKTYYNTNRSDPHYRIGDRVLMRVHGLKGKLDPPFSTVPQIIVEIHHPIYIIRDELTGSDSRVHVADLRPLFLD